MKRITIIFMYDSQDCHYLVIDNNTGKEVKRGKEYYFDEDFDEDELAALLATDLCADSYEVVHW